MDRRLKKRTTCSANTNSRVDSAPARPCPLRIMCVFKEQNLTGHALFPFSLLSSLDGMESEAVAQWNRGMAHVKLDVAFSEPEFSVFPNPATDRVDIRWSQPKSGATQVDILDAAGRLVLSQTLGSLPLGDQQVILSVSNLSPGTYQMRLTTDGQPMFQSSLHRTE